jgi:hypothetical protein
MTMSIVLLIFLGLIKITFVGFEQAEADGAAFVAAHAASMVPTNGVGQVSRGVTYAQAAFPGFPRTDTSQQIVVSQGVPVNGLNLLVSQATRVAGGLMLGQGFGGGVGQINLRSQLVEPVTVAPLKTAGLSAAVKSPGAPNCLGGAPSTTTNNATSNSTPWGCTMNLATSDYSQTNPFAQYECHLAYFASLTTSGVNLGDVSSSTYGSYDTSSLLDGAGHTLQQHSWPGGYQWRTGGSINDPGVRSGGVFLTTQVSPYLNPNPDGSRPANSPYMQNIGGGSSGGYLGTQLTPIFRFGLANDPCA